MESFKLPLREINARYRKSEIVILSWSSAETSFKMKQKIEASSHKRKESISAKDLDMSQLTDREARKYFKDMGLEFPIITSP